MKNAVRSIFSVVSMAAGLATITAAFAAGYPKDFLGYPAEADSYTRVISISNGTSVNVNHNEIVKFVNASNGASFVWRFYTPATTFDLNDVATSGFMDGRHAGIYVAKDSSQN
jgi:hypothetical protein